MLRPHSKIRYPLKTIQLKAIIAVTTKKELLRSIRSDFSIEMLLNEIHEGIRPHIEEHSD